MDRENFFILLLIAVPITLVLGSILWGVRLLHRIVPTRAWSLMFGGVFGLFLVMLGLGMTFLSAPGAWASILPFTIGVPVCVALFAGGLFLAARYLVRLSTETAGLEDEVRHRLAVLDGSLPAPGPVVR